MGLVKMLLFEGIRTQRMKSMLSAKEAAKGQMHNLGKAAVTKSDVDRIAGHVEQVRDDVHKGMSDLYQQAQQNDHVIVHQLHKLNGLMNEHNETLKQLLDVIKSHGLI